MSLVPLSLKNLVDALVDVFPIDFFCRKVGQEPQRYCNCAYCDPLLPVDGFDHNSTPTSSTFFATIPVNPYRLPLLGVLDTFNRYLRFSFRSQIRQMVRLMKRRRKRAQNQLENHVRWAPFLENMLPLLLLHPQKHTPKLSVWHISRRRTTPIPCTTTSVHQNTSVYKHSSNENSPLLRGTPRHRSAENGSPDPQKRLGPFSTRKKKPKMDPGAHFSMSVPQMKENTVKMEGAVLKNRCILAICAFPKKQISLFCHDMHV